MLVGNLGAQVIQGLVLGPCLHAFGKDEHLSQMVLINRLVMLFAGLMPVHGGVGVAEAGYVAYLQTIGIPSAVAMSTALLYRLVTLYLPPIWGSFAMGWLGPLASPGGTRPAQSAAVRTGRGCCATRKQGGRKMRGLSHLVYSAE